MFTHPLNRNLDMASAIRVSPCIIPLHHIARAMVFYPISKVMRVDSLCPNLVLYSEKLNLIGCKPVASCREEVVSVDQTPDKLPISVQLESISNQAQFDRIITETQQLEQPVVIVWMANWCRKCIYLKPKLEKLAEHYHPSIRFYCVDVNNVSHKLVARAEVTKMPTIQLWNAGKKQGEVIGGHKAHLVVNDVHEMIEIENS